MEFQLDMFERLADVANVPVVVCRLCGCAVWGSQIQGHLNSSHKELPAAVRKQIATDVGSWPDIAMHPCDLILPPIRSHPIPQLVKPIDGFQCLLPPGTGLDPSSSETCLYVCLSDDGMRAHWRSDHEGYTLSTHFGGSTKATKKEIQAARELVRRDVKCQQLFTRGQSTQYFAIIREDEADPSPDSSLLANIDQLWARAGANWQELERRLADKVGKGFVDEVNNWLRRTGWVSYLDSFSFSQLSALIVKPEKPDQPALNGSEPHAIWAVWSAMGDVGQLSQLSVADMGHFVRTEAIRTEKDQSLFKPLVTYQDPESIDEKVRPWQQVLMFFWRTQHASRDKRVPKYRFTPRQKEKWERLVNLARPTTVVGRSLTLRAGQRAPWESPPSPCGSAFEIFEDASTGLGPEDRSTWEGCDALVDGDDSATEDERPGTPVGDDDCHDDPPATPLTPIQQACLDFCLELLNQRVVFHEYDLPLVCATAVLGVRSDGWRTFDDYPPILSKLIKMARFMVVRKCIQLTVANHVPRYQSASTDWDCVAQRSAPPSNPSQRGCVDWVGHMMDTFMVRGTRSPMQWMLDLRTYGLKIHNNTTADGHVGWQNKDELLYKDICFTMVDFRGMVDRTVREAKRILVEELLQCAPGDVPTIPWANLYDNPNNEEHHWSFLKDTRTKWPVDGSSWLQRRIQLTPSLRRQFIAPDGHNVNRSYWHVFERRVHTFLEKLLAAVQFSWGQPARAPELLSLRHENTPVGGLRNIFIEDRMVAMVAKYHKGYQMTGDVKIIQRYLPREVGELLIWYLWLVLPFLRRINALLYRLEEIHSHLWADIAGQPQWHRDRVRQVIQRESRIGLNGQTLTTAAYRDVAIAISRKFLRGSRAFMRNAEDEAAAEEEEDDIMGRIADEQATHGPNTAGNIYAREWTERKGEVADRRLRFRQSSLEWHEFLGFKSATLFLHDEPPSPFHTLAERSQRERWNVTRTTDAQQALREMMGAATVFRGNQQAIIKAIVQRESPIVAVMPTGGGKSLLFMLPAWIGRGGTTVVVVPLVALREDIRLRCQQLGISCAEWDPRRAMTSASIVLVTPEAAVGEPFQTFINRKRSVNELDRIVIDECHTVLQEGYRFRKQMSQLGLLVRAQTQMVLLTATLPRDCETTLCERMYFDPHHTLWFRSRTSRINVRYGVRTVGQRPVTQAAVEADVVAWIQRRLQRLQQRADRGKVVVYCSTQATTDRLALQLRCPAFHGKTLDRSGILAAFRQQARGVIAATSALGMGIDIPDIRMVIHVGPPRTLLDYGQESGRAGRDGQPSLAIILRDGSGRDFGYASPVDERVLGYLDGGCHRRALDVYLDGTVDGYLREQCDKGEVPCDYCRRHQPSPEAVDVDLEPDEAKEEDEEVEEDSDEDSSLDEDASSNDKENVDASHRRSTDRPRARDEPRGAPLSAILPNGRRKRAVSRSASESLAKRHTPSPFPPPATYQAPAQRRQAQVVEDQTEVESIENHFDDWCNRCRLCEMDHLADEHSLSACRHPQAAQARIWAAHFTNLVRNNVKEDKKQGYEPYAACWDCHSPQWLCSKWVSDGTGGYRRTDSVCQYDHTAFHVVAQLLNSSQGSAIRKAWGRRLRTLSPPVDVDNDRQLVRHFQRRMGQRRGEERSGLVVEMNWFCEFVRKELVLQSP